MAKIEEFMANDLDATLNYYVRNGFRPNSFYYNCSSIEDPFAIGQKRPILGIYFMTVGTLILSVYLPCLFVISRSDLMKSSCYKIMLYLGVMDTCCLTVNSLITGFLGFIGATFCSYPRFIYLAGAIGVGCWMGSCSTCILLAINRCSDINHNLPFRKMFIGRNVYFTMLIPVFYTIYAVFFTKPIIFNSNYMSWFFNPNLGLNSDYYVNFPHTVNNCCVSLCTTSLYGYLSLLIHYKSKHSQSETLSKTQKQVSASEKERIQQKFQIFTQSVLICSCNAVAAYIYVYMQFFYSPPAIILLGQIAWQCAHASVCVVYITWNKSVRRKVIDLLVPEAIKLQMKGRVGSTNTARRMMSIAGGDLLKGATTTNSGTVF